MSISANFPTIRPSLLLDFSDTRTLDPRITFARASTATFYDQTSTAVAEQNLVTYSQDVSNAAWGKTNSTATANYTTAPDGTSTANAVYETAVSSTQHSAQGTGNTSSAPVTFSCYLKKGDGATAPDWIQITTGGGSAAHANFNLTTGLAGNTDATSTITSVGSGWYRCTMTITVNVSSVSFILGFTNNTDSTVRYAAVAYTGAVTSNVFVWGAQAEVRASVTAYTPTTTAAITNYIPVLQTAASGVARFDCNPVTRESLGLLIEESRTNLLTYSSAFDNAAWVKTAATITTAATVAPDGTQTAQLLVEDTTAAIEHRIRETNIVKTANQVLSYSAYVKPAGRYFVLFMEYSGSGLGTSFDVVNNQYTDNAPAAGWTRGQTTLTSVGNGWYRCTISGTTDINTIINTRVQLSNVYPSTFNTPAYTGNGYSGIFIWGAQLEAGSFATSYIPTVASQVTRAADSASMTGTNFSSWYNQSQGTIYTDVSNSNIGSGSSGWSVPVSIEDGIGGYGNVTLIRGGAGNVVQTSGVGTTFSQTPGTVYKTAIRINAANYQSVVNGTLSALSTVPTAVPFNQNRMGIGWIFQNSSSFLNGSVKRIAYYPVALTSTQLQAITS